MSSPEIIEEGAEAAKPAEPKSRKKLILIGAAAAVLLLGGGGGAAFMLSGSGAKAEGAKDAHGGAKEAAASGGGHGEAAAGDAGKGAFVDVPAMLVNLRSPDGQARFLRIHFMIVPGDGIAPDGLKEKLPLVLDSFQPFLRELRPEDLSGSAAVFRIKEEMMVRATATLGEGQVKDILIQDLVQQ
ncbi:MULTISPECIES: flagellar basal body-associated FliL family protein [Sphingomonas]|uniref:Flagellar protein FliL n=1 Tax=Sphingomonas leidyi TaxID=68569 RepID=A0A7X5ZWW9_9SPHN|nr:MULTISPECIES: flagellar basal body-associated FliL family protein [Sphingomonas]MBN8811276.1 flagellar basal body-associated FliL family protein [Sphingomonas sp.]NIJ66581.1 flagellar FliL protein [Sphingomonas leidyi]OJY54731.1 MAG: flagellar basal body protein FliL [Sphingomonas sp. 67-41]